MRALLLVAVIVAAVISACVILLGVAVARAHDIYNGVRGPAGQLCCGGDPVTGDCEGLVDEFIQVGKDDVRIFSKRYGAWITVAKDSVLWMTIPADKGVHQGHYCGVRRSATVTTPDQPDPNFMTYCIFLSPGGV